MDGKLLNNFRGFGVFDLGKPDVPAIIWLDDDLFTAAILDSIFLNPLSPLFFGRAFIHNLWKFNLQTFLTALTDLSHRLSVSLPKAKPSTLLDTCREAHDGKEEPICVEVLEHALHRLPVDPEWHAGGAQVQTAADHVVRVQQVLVNGGHGPGDAT